MENFQALILIGRWFFIMKKARITTEILKLKKNFRRKQKWNQNIPKYLTFSSIIFVIKVRRYYKHSDKEVTIL